MTRSTESAGAPVPRFTLFAYGFRAQWRPPGPGQENRDEVSALMFSHR